MPPDPPTSDAPGPVDPLVTMWGLVMEATAAVNRRLEQDLLRELDIPLTYFEVLLRLRRTDGGVGLNALAAQVSFSSGGFSRLVDRLEARTLVERRPCPTNRRSTLVGLTPHGRDVIDRAVEIHAAGLRRLVAAAGEPAQIATTADLMRAVRDAAPRQ